MDRRSNHNGCIVTEEAMLPRWSGRSSALQVGYAFTQGNRLGLVFFRLSASCGGIVDCKTHRVVTIPAHAPCALRWRAGRLVVDGSPTPCQNIRIAHDPTIRLMHRDGGKLWHRFRDYSFLESDQLAVSLATRRNRICEPKSRQFEGESAAFEEKGFDPGLEGT